MKSDFTHTLILPVVQRGNLGKSTCMAALAAWVEQRGVLWQGFDLDPDHQSFARLFPESVQLVPLSSEEPEGDVIKIMRLVTATPVTLIDPRAHLSPTILKAWDMIRFPGTFAETGGRITALVFAADDLEVMNDLDATVTRLGDSVNYIVVRNPARSARTRMFDTSELEGELRRLGAAFVEIPVLLSLARNHLAAKEAELNRGITHAEAVGSRDLGLDPMVRVLIEDWLRTVFRRFDAIAPHLLPPAYAAKIAPVDVAPNVSATRRGAKLNLKNL